MIFEVEQSSDLNIGNNDENGFLVTKGEENFFGIRLICSSSLLKILKKIKDNHLIISLTSFLSLLAIHVLHTQQIEYHE
jgi:hypothetical protein